MDKTTSADGTTIAFDRTGDGPPVIIVEGAFCDRSTSAPMAALLAERFAVFAYDRRGRGDSADTAPYSVEREVEDLAALIEEAGGSAALYGMSSGAVLAIEAAASGLAVTRLALYEPPLSTGDDQRARTDDLLAALTGLIAADRRGDAVELFLAKGVKVPSEVVAQMRTAPMWHGLEAIAHTLVYDATITSDASVLAERASTVPAPTLVLDGAESPAFLREAVRAVADTIPGARHRSLAGQTHDVDPAVLAPVLTEFFG